MKKLFNFLFTILLSSNVFAQSSFITRWDLSVSGSGATVLSIPVTTAGTVSYSWMAVSPATGSGSGTFNANTLTLSDLPEDAVIELTIAPENFTAISMHGNDDAPRLIDVKAWGTVAWSTMNNAFNGCKNLNINAIDAPDLSAVSDMSGMFNQCSSLNGPIYIDSWDTGNVTDMSSMFSGASVFDQDISGWNTENVTTMSGMFSEAAAFNQPIVDWNTGKVTDMNGMFGGATLFDQAIGGWDTRNVTDMSNMFVSAAAFNQPIGDWDTEKVTNMSGMFNGAVLFDHPIGDWETSNVIDMNSMFYSASVFNQEIGSWETSNVTDMNSMFYSALAFNQAVGDWDTGSVTNMSNMFSGASAFDQPIDNWDTGNVANMESMFASASAFNRPIGGWNTGNVTNMSGMFGATALFNQDIDSWDTGDVVNMNNMFVEAASFNQSLGSWTLNEDVTMEGMLDNSGMSCGNYSATLIGWNSNAGTPDGVTLGASGIRYGNDAAAARTNLTDVKGWSITDAGSAGANCPSGPSPFVTQWDLSISGSEATGLSIPVTTTGMVSYSWEAIAPATGSGSGTFSDNTLTLTGLPEGAVIELTIDPKNFTAITMIDADDAPRLIDISAWGTVKWSSMNNAFNGCTNLEISATDLPDLFALSDMSGMFNKCSSLNGPANIGSWDTGTVTDMSSMFSGASVFDQAIGSWNTENVTSMSGLFSEALVFDQSIENWDTGNVTNMNGMFGGAALFNQPIGGWDTGNVTDMSNMFVSATKFNKPIGGWSTGNVTNMNGMFLQATSFDQAIGEWETGSVTDMGNMFFGATSFNQDIGDWETGNVTNMNAMFSGASSFDKPLSDWDTDNVTNMENLFSGASSFDQPIGSWSTANVTNMTGVFSSASLFNQEIGSWETGNVTNMSGMFSGAALFDQPLDSWDVGNVTNVDNMFNGAVSFDQSVASWTLNENVTLEGMFDYSGMSCGNYSATLEGWHSNNPTVTGKTLGATGLYYVGSAHDDLVDDRSWTITGDTQATGPAKLVENEETVTAVEGCVAEFAMPAGSDGKIIQISPDGNTNFTSDDVTITVTNQFASSLPSDVFIPTDALFYESSTTGQTLRVTKRLHIIQPNGSETYSVNGGVTVRVYFDQAEIDVIEDESTLSSGNIIKSGWFKSEKHTVADLLNDMSPSRLANAIEITPIAQGEEDGIAYVEFKMQSFSTIGYYASTEGAPLPVKLVAFEAKKSESSIWLTWETSEEVNSNHFEIQYSLNGKNWKALGTVQAEGHRSQYRFEDKSFNKGVNYYRLKMVDNDGSQAMSRIISINLEAAEDAVAVYPNPVDNELRVGGLRGAGHMNVTNLSGKILLPWTAFTSTENALDVKNLTPGIYLIQIRDKNGVTTKKFVKK